MNRPTSAPHPTDLLSEYLDDGLDPATRSAVRAHLEGCAGCARLLASLDAVKRSAAALPETAPPDAVWEGIAARIAGAPEAPRATIDLAAERWRRERRTFSMPRLAAAAAGLVVVSAAIGWFAATRGPWSRPTGPGAAALPPEMRAPSAADTTDPRPAATTPAAPEGRGPVAAPPAAPPAGRVPRAPGDPIPQAEVADFGTAGYDRAIADLEAVLAAHERDLDPQTVAVVRRNLALIDRAIEDARRALASDPASPYLNGHLASAMQLKVDLLRRVTAAARI
jgi:hypothetical protein